MCHCHYNDFRDHIASSDHKRKIKEDEALYSEIDSVINELNFEDKKLAAKRKRSVLKASKRGAKHGLDPAVAILSMQESS